MLVLREAVSLLYYPLWLVDYQVADRPYRIVVDANDGTVNSGTAPAANQRLNPVLMLRVAALLVVAAARGLGRRRVGPPSACRLSS